MVDQFSILSTKVKIHNYIYTIYIYIYIYIYKHKFTSKCTNSLVNAIVRLPHPRSRDSQGQERF